MNTGQKLSFEEFRLFYESTEKVTDRRLEANRWNYSICLATIVAVAGTIEWSLAKNEYFYVGVTVASVFCVIAALFCSLWMGQSRDLKALNNAKFDVLNQMAPKVEFDPSKPDCIVSFRPFEKEWLLLQKAKATQEVLQSKIIALRSSNIEYFIPAAFRSLFLMLIFVFILAIVFHWNSFVDSWQALLNASQSTAVQSKP